MKNLKGGKLPRLADNLGFIQIKKVNFLNNNNVDDIISSFLFKDKELKNLKKKFNELIEREITDNNKKQNIKNELEKLIDNKSDNTPFNVNILREILHKSLTIIFKELYKYDENFKNDANTKFICDKSEGDLSSISISSNDLNSLNNLNKSKIKQHVKIILYKIISALSSDNDKQKFILALDEITKNDIFKKRDNEVFMKINKHTNKLFNFLHKKDHTKKGNLLNIY